MSEHPIPTDAPLAGKATESSWGPWAPGVWLLRQLSPGIRVALLLALTLLPALPWLVPSVRLAALPHAWAPLLVVALYGWACAGLLARAKDDGPHHEPVAAGPHALSPPRNLEAQPLPSALVAQTDDERRAALAGGGGPAPAAQPEPSPPSPAAQVPQPKPAEAPPVLEPADFRLGNAEIRGATDEIARRVVGTSGLLDACSKAAADALADIEALHDEDRHAQKLLSALRGRLLLLDQRCHALAQVALLAAQGEQGTAGVSKQLQAAGALVLHIHQLAERLAAVERNHGVRMESLRRSVELVDGHSERGLRESQQMMMLTRRVFTTLDAADHDLCRVEIGRDMSDDGVVALSAS